MYNWSTDTRALKQNPTAFAVWHLEQLINFGLGDEKISKAELQAYLPKLHIDPWRKKLLLLLLHED